MTPSERRSSILDRVRTLICKDRQNAYGDAEDNFSDIAERWSIYLSRRFKFPINVTSADVAAMMIDQKLARLAANPLYQDNWDDIIGYGGCGAAIVELDNEIFASVVNP